MEKNIGTIDKIVRLTIAAGLIITGIVLAPQGLWWISLIAIVPIGTAAIGTCPLYLPLGIKTIKVQKYKA